MQLNKPFDVVMPTLDGDVLAVLASARETFTINQVNRILTSASAEGIPEVLNRLSAQGVVIHGQVGRTHTYRPNTEHLAAEPILTLAQLASTLLERIETSMRDWAQQVNSLARAVTAWPGNDARIVEYLEADLRAAAAIGEPLLRDVATQGLTVAGTRAWLTRLLREAERTAITVRG